MTCQTCDVNSGGVLQQSQKQSTSADVLGDLQEVVGVGGAKCVVFRRCCERSRCHLFHALVIYDAVDLFLIQTFQCS
eukprot:2580055-Rhodomonas_salina.2